MYVLICTCEVSAGFGTVFARKSRLATWTGPSIAAALRLTTKLRHIAEVLAGIPARELGLVYCKNLFEVSDTIRASACIEESLNVIRLEYSNSFS